MCNDTSRLQRVAPNAEHLQVARLPVPAISVDVMHVQHANVLAVAASLAPPAVYPQRDITVGISPVLIVRRVNGSDPFDALRFVLARAPTEVMASPTTNLALRSYKYCPALAAR
jgi:hypothetical protein